MWDGGGTVCRRTALLMKTEMRWRGRRLQMTGPGVDPLRYARSAWMTMVAARVGDDGGEIALPLKNRDEGVPAP